MRKGSVLKDVKPINSIFEIFYSVSQNVKFNLNVVEICAFRVFVPAFVALGWNDQNWVEFI